MSKDIKVFLDYLSSQTGLPIDQVSRETEESLAGVVEKNIPKGHVSLFKSMKITVHLKSTGSGLLCKMVITT